MTLGLKCEGESDQVAQDAKVYEGFVELQVPESYIEDFYDKQDIYLDESLLEEDCDCLYQNQFIMLTSDADPKKTALGFFKSYAEPIREVVGYKNGVWGVQARNKEQKFAIDMLMNPDLPLVSVIGKAGSGKSLISLAAGLEQVVGVESRYKRLIHPDQFSLEDIGFLPGDMQEKMILAYANPR